MDRQREGWVEIEVEFTGGPLVISVPRDCVSLTMGKTEVLADPRGEIERALSNPLGCPHLPEIIRRKGKPPGELKAAITVSDITRPVPYKGPNGFLTPLLLRLQEAGLTPANILIIVGTGTHRASTAREKAEMLGEEIVSAYSVRDHDCEDHEAMAYVGKTPGGTDICVNRWFKDADLKIATGLVESHFMAGASGGRKAVCPGLVDLKTIERFHSPDFLESPQATNLIFEGNPCHEEASAVARSVGVDFAVNATLDKGLNITGVFAGDLDLVFHEAVRKIRSYVEIPVQEEFDIVLTHGGYVGRNHYQTAKAAVAALPAVKAGGVIILAADNRDPEPIGGGEYKTLLHLMKMQGPDGYVSLLKSPSWRFTKDQWGPEPWGKVLRKVGERGLIYCTADIPEERFAMLPGRSGYEFLPPNGREKPRIEKMQEMVQEAVFSVCRTAGRRHPRMAFICEGPYAVPVKIEG